MSVKGVDMVAKDRDVASYIAHKQTIMYMESIGMFKSLHLHHAPAICAYIMASPGFLPFKTVIVGERPYSSKIHPPVSSAMSYDVSKSKATPSTLGLARDVSFTTDVPYVEAEAWARDSWMYAHSGTLVVNCTVFKSFSSSDSLSEVVPFQRWIRCMLDCSIACGSSKIEVICMGVPATNVIDSVIRSMGKMRSHVYKKPYPNPAIVSKTGIGDGSSRAVTFGKPGTSKSIAKAIIRSRDYRPLTPRDYIRSIRKNMTSHTAQVAEVITASSKLVDALEGAFDDLRTSDRMPALRECQEQFANALLTYRDLVIRDVLEHTVASKSDSNSSKMGRPVEWGGKKQWSKGAPSTGTSSKMSVVQEDGGGVVQKFADDDDEGQLTETEKPSKGKSVDRGEPSGAADDEPPSTPTQPRPKKKTVRKVRKVKKVVKPLDGTNSKRSSVASAPSIAIKEETVTVAGMSIDESQESTLRSILYYVSDTYGEVPIYTSINDTLTERAVTDDLVGTILDTAARDMETDGVSAQRSLGLDDGNVMESSLLVKVLAKVAGKPQA